MHFLKAININKQCWIEFPGTRGRSLTSVLPLLDPKWGEVFES